VLLVGSSDRADAEARGVLDHHLDSGGGVDAYRLVVQVERVSGRRPGAQGTVDQGPPG
jgi:hypothetical protein